jgi:hypothetical protein
MESNVSGEEEPNGCQDATLVCWGHCRALTPRGTVGRCPDVNACSPRPAPDKPCLKSRAAQHHQYLECGIPHRVLRSMVSRAAIVRTQTPGALGTFRAARALKKVMRILMRGPRSYRLSGNSSENFLV